MSEKSDDKKRHLKRANMLAKAYANRPIWLLVHTRLNGPVGRLAHSVRNRELRAAGVDPND